MLFDERIEKGGIEMNRIVRIGIYMLCVCLVLAFFASAQAAGTSPTTGKETDAPYRPILVQISNSPEARPILGLGQADIVYEMIYWGPQHTRYLAVFNDEHPETVGYLRGTRVFGMSMQMQWDCPFVFRGGQDSPGTSIYDFMTENGITRDFGIDLVRGAAPDAQFLVKDRPHPHSSAINLQMVSAQYWPTDEGGNAYVPRDPGIVFTQTPFSGDIAAQTLTLAYGNSDYIASYAYDNTAGHWVRSYNGTPQLDGTTDGPIVADNIIVQGNALSFYENNDSRPIIEAVGEGPFYAFIDGQMAQGTWSRPALEDITHYTLENGEPLALKPGKTFVQIVSMPMLEAITGEETGDIHFSNEYWMNEYALREASSL